MADGIPQQPSMQPSHHGPSLKELQEAVTSVASRLSVLEGWVANLRRKTQVTEQGLIAYENETRADIKAFLQHLTELAHNVDEVKEQLDAIAGELSTVVKRPEFAVLERYMDFWQPLDFVTRSEAQRLIDEAKRQR
ncbi:hypothetical protein D6789_03270 [Candidatus Woesearchaeota archaeon]|nr:MAG: hypothetical protein D6789_03270 [Candidatus Woesearchaeota archaeon]